MSRPWTAIWKDTTTGKRKSSIFQGSFDTKRAVEEFKTQHTGRSLEVLIPGSHNDLYIDRAESTINSGNELLKHDLWSHDHGVE